MISKIIMPPGGQTTTSSLVSNWLVKKGDTVKRGDVLLEVETDKAVLAVESFVSGIVIDILVEAGNEASEGDGLALIGTEQDLKIYWEEKERPEPPAEQTLPVHEDEDEYQPIIRAQEQKDQTVSKPQNKSIPAMPNAKKAAREHGIDIATLRPEKGDVIKLADVMNAVKQKQSTTETHEADYTVVPANRMRKTIARRMKESVNDVPMYQVTVALDMRALIALRKQYDSKISFNDLFMRCLCAAIKRYPLINASYVNDEIWVYKHINIGLAVAVEDGLVVPVVKKAEKMGVLEIAESNKANVAKAREGTLQSQDMSGGTITISNLGMYPVEHFTAIINQPESCILAIGQIQERPALEAGEWVAVPTATVTASFDHRIIDGAYGAQFLTEFKKLAENPALCL